MNATQTLLVQLAVSAVMSVFVAWLAATLSAQMTLRRFYKEKMWERKANAYTTILEALGDLFAWFDKNLDAVYVHEQLGENESNELSEAFKRAHKEMTRTMAGQVWLLSPQVAAAIKAMNSTLDYTDYPDFHSHLDEGYGAVKTCRETITALAQKDLQVEEAIQRSLVAKMFAKVRDRARKKDATEKPAV